MIKYNLKCCNDHEFESWFLDSNEFDKLNKKKLLECIFCSSKKINKSIMAPMIVSSKKIKDDFKTQDKDLQNKKIKLVEIRKYIENNFEYVGENFSQKVREIYYDKDKKKTIYGTTTAEEREELAEEGIDLLSVPWVSKDN
mgnify:FL=1|tara:strand:+ start:1325 stop:1747 length:423 start_codon:yes stop_codon:yes gene_type:complete